MIPLPEHIPIFPLSEVVLFPDTMLPLHIFEPRYRKMLADALDGDRVIGMVLIKDPDADPPAVYPVGCAGTIIEHKPFADGRSMIVLQGTVKFRIRRELDADEPYRVVQAQALYEGPPPMDLVRSWREELRQNLIDLVKASSGEEEMIHRLFEKLDLMAMTNSLCASLPLDVLEKQSLLECATIEQREHQLSTLLQFKVAEARLGIDASRDADT
ncbi:MAG TPA: LON peptidase substrate-binding domain-containing protein [Candidatus Limnocylindrales bacterium]|nr:LON peptidase substrate-binding domain-containing protein [Candidatus Limnocylindrales bacterium]